jgi:undecaprenyl-diphosphatase
MILLDSGTHPGLLHSILQGDYWLFSRINQDWTNPFLDGLLLFMRESELWVPFYLFLLVFITLNFRKKGWWWSLYLVMTAIISDLLSSNLIKGHLVWRTRPCGDPQIADTVRFIANYCPASSSFTSSHAVNHFAMAFFIYRTLRHTSRWWGIVFLWAFLISYAQVYVGVHFPLDVTCGALLGSLIGWQLSRLFKFQFGTLHLQPYNPSHA